MLEHLKTIITSCFPELGHSSFTLLTTGWDSVAVDVDDQLIFKFPRDEEAAHALRREASMLQVIRPRVRLPVPDLVCFEMPEVFSKHTKLRGDHLETPQYEALSLTAKQKLAEDLARFYAELHALNPALMHSAGALPTDQWPHLDVIATGIQPFLSQSLRQKAQEALDAWAQLAPDPRVVYGFFDGHGWNMAFNHETQTLAGLYDFADAGFGDLHEEFIYTNFISSDLTARVIMAYEQLTGRLIDRNRVSVLTGVLLLVELADMGHDPDHADTVLNNASTWFSRQL